MRRLAILGSAMIAMAAPAAAGPPPQYVIISFDGALHVEQWERSRALARETGARFTYFLSCVYLLTWDTRPAYRAPDSETPRSNVGYGYSREDVAARLDHIWQARSEGHEMASHGCGHFDGSDWTRAQWSAEFERFHDIVADAWALNDIAGEPEDWRAFAREEFTGFRAPYLAHGEPMFQALAAQGYRYDASTVSQEPALPTDEGGLTRFALPLIPEGPDQRPVLAMDYNLFVRHSAGIERPDRDGIFEDRTIAAFQGALERELAGARTPLQIGYHFTLMNDGAYWNALERFVRDNCGRSDVECIGHRDYLDRVAPAGG